MAKVLWSVLGLGAIAALLLFGCTFVSGSDKSATTRVSATPLADSVEVSDRISHPPIRQSFEAAPYELVVSATDNWRTPRAEIELYNQGALLWHKDLPHDYGPRFVLVNAQGQVALFDEYINVSSPYAITLIDASGTEVAQYSFDNIKQVLADISLRDITGQALSGFWISAIPMFSAQGNGDSFLRNRALVKTGGTSLELDMSTGQLIRRDDL